MAPIPAAVGDAGLVDLMRWGVLDRMAPVPAPVGDAGGL
jgi:hypothetical protein